MRGADLEALEEFRGFYVHSGHDWEHVVRVTRLAMKIARSVECDEEVVEYASWLHDVARGREMAGEIPCHAEEGAKMAGMILKDLLLPGAAIEAVAYCIKVHRYKSQIEPATMEARILQDADRLDCLGATCIARAFRHDLRQPTYDPVVSPGDYLSGGTRTVINFLLEKPLLLRPEGFHTECARDLARGRWEFTMSFVDRFIAEWHDRL